MTVAAVIVSATADEAIAPADGVPRVRRMADAAWAGGAVPVIVVSPDPDGAVAAALAGSEARLVTPAAATPGLAARMAEGFHAAVEAIRETDAALLWPVRMCWADAETLTSLIEAHGVDRRLVIRPSWRGRDGWPALVPVDALTSLATVAPGGSPSDALRALADARRRLVAVDLGDPGTILDATTPRDELPSYEGPPRPASGHHHDWGASAAERPDDEPVEVLRTAD